MRRALTPIICLEILVLVLVAMQLPGGVRTDEAKYLLSIPYPHPPFLRGIIASTLSWSFQESFWRLAFATLVVQSAWVVWDLGIVLPRDKRLTLVFAWLLAPALLLQGGTIILTVPAACAGLVFVWLALEQRDVPKKYASLIALLWLASLFSVYQSVLFAPLVLSVLLRTKISKRLTYLYWLVPVGLLGLYTLSNPLAIASMLNVANQDTTLAFADRLFNIFWTYALAGGVLTVVGLAGVVKSGRRDLQASAFLVLVFIALSAQYYYAILLTPILIGGLYVQLCRRRIHTPLFLLCQVACSLFLVWSEWPQATPSPARATMSAIHAQGIGGPIIIDGFFGHEWTYESGSPVRRFTQDLSTEMEEKAEAIVCTRNTCEENVDTETWMKLDGTPVEVWVRR